MSTTFRAHFDGQALIPDGPVDLPIGCVLEVRASPLTAADPRDFPLRRLADVLSQFPDNPDSPADGAAQHDHYLYGTPKRK
ncbi:MAG TPA: hypothetical protein VF278_16340 [Pirellulales bacterium]